MNDQIEACYDQFVPMPEPVQYLAQICYASVPGWCCHAQVLRPRVVLRQRLLRRSLLQRRLLGSVGGAGLQRLLQPRQPFLLGLPQRRQDHLHQPQRAAWRSGTPTGCGTTATGTTRWHMTGSCTSPRPPTVPQWLGIPPPKRGSATAPQMPATSKLPAQDRRPPTSASRWSVSKSRGPR